MDRSPRRKARAGEKGHFRVIAGAWKRRRLAFLGDGTIRPTPDRLRETLFNWLMADVVDARVLDLFAGSGALGIEALSRGASRVDFVELDARAARDINAHLADLGAVDRATVHTCDAYGFALAGRQYDLILVDPPYHTADYPVCLSRLPCALATGHRVYVEHGAGRAFTWPSGWRELRQTRSGQAMGRLGKYTGDSDNE